MKNYNDPSPNINRSIIVDGFPKQIILFRRASYGIQLRHIQYQYVLTQQTRRKFNKRWRTTKQKNNLLQWFFFIVIWHFYKNTK